MADRPTVMPAWVSNIACALDQLGLNASTLMRQAGLDQAAIASAQTRLPASDLASLWQQALANDAQRPLGLEVARHLNLTSMLALGTALVSSASSADACRRLARFVPLLCDAVTLHIIEQAEGITLEFVSDTSESAVCAADIDLLMATVARFLSESTQGRLLAIEVTRRLPANTAAAAYEDHFGCAVRMGQPRDLIRLPRNAWEEPIGTAADAELDHLSDQMLEAYLQHWESDPITAQVRAEIINRLPAGEPELAEVAQTLQHSMRTMQRRLDAANTTFSGLIRTAREELANSYLLDARYTLRDIALLLGFSDQANFTRAFKSWYGIAPGRYRRQLQERQTVW